MYYNPPDHPLPPGTPNITFLLTANQYYTINNIQAFLIDKPIDRQNYYHPPHKIADLLWCYGVYPKMINVSAADWLLNDADG